MTIAVAETDHKRRHARRKGDQMKKVTVKQMLEFGPCKEYSESRVRKLWAGNWSLIPLQISELDIPAADRVWALCRVLDPDIRTRWINMIVERAIRKYVLGCGIPEVEQWGERWISGADRSSTEAKVAAWAAAAAWAVKAAAAWAVKAAAAAAWAAKAAAAAAAVREAKVAVWEVAEAAAWAAREAKVAAAREAAWAAAATAEYEQQIKDLQSLLTVGCPSERSKA